MIGNSVFLVRGKTSVVKRLYVSCLTAVAFSRSRPGIPEYFSFKLGGPGTGNILRVSSRGLDDFRSVGNVQDKSVLSKLLSFEATPSLGQSPQYPEKGRNGPTPDGRMWLTPQSRSARLSLCHVFDTIRVRFQAVQECTRSPHRMPLSRNCVLDRNMEIREVKKPTGHAAFAFP